jgi:hypothetical protein
VASQRQLFEDNVFRFFFAAALSSLFFVNVWYAAIGVTHDWNLFSVVGLTCGVAVWYALTRLGDSPNMQMARSAWAFLALTHTLGWVLHNHFDYPTL